MQERNLLYQADCMEMFRHIPSASVDLVIADPPYYHIKGEFDFTFQSVSEYLEWCRTWAEECYRILKTTGAFYCWGSSQMIDKLSVEVLDQFGFNVYQDVREKLTELGIPEEEVAFIHDAGTEAKKAELFAKVRSGKVRILLGSTPKLGAGTNIQDRLAALHHLDCPWKPSDVGRILRTFKIKKNVEVTDNGKDDF